MSLLKTLVASRNQAGLRGICPGKAGMAHRDLRVVNIEKPETSPIEPYTRQSGSAGKPF